MAEPAPTNASAGHRLGQVIGDWYEEYFVLPLLTKVADHLQLYLDHRFRKRPVRREKIVWADDENNDVDYDFVLELDGTDEQLGIPVAFLECFWRRGARHSKDKARDDSGKLMPNAERASNGALPWHHRRWRLYETSPATCSFARD